MPTRVRDRSREMFRERLAEALSEVFVARGFDDVTVAEAARAVGISRATFFRYFSSKEDAALASVEGSNFDFGAVLADLDLRPDDSCWSLLQRTFRHSLAGVGGATSSQLDQLRMIHATPSLRARLSFRRLQLEPSLTAARVGHGVPADRAHTAAMAGLAALEVAWERWALHESPSLARALDEAFADLTAADKPISAG